LTSSGVWMAPGRVNLIGEHTDYNGGFVLPLALPFGVSVAGRRRDDRQLSLRSRQEPDEPVTVPVDELTPGRVKGWAVYPAGVVWALREAGQPVEGVDLIVDGDVPQGAGLSSSAALECATAVACVDLFALDLSRLDLARLAQRAENEFAGVPVGIMDQTAALVCTAGHALFLDTRALEFEQVPFDVEAAGLALLVIDTRAPHRLVQSEYADRRHACESAARLLGVEMLRDIDVSSLDEALRRLPEDGLRRRVRHVVSENARVIGTVDRLRAGEIRSIGPLLTASHESLRDDYEVSSPELDVAVDAALGAGALGARMTGGGFGGCAIALVGSESQQAVVDAVEGAFARRGFTAPHCVTVTASDGARRMSQSRSG
jgi:galactokinase